MSLVSYGRTLLVDGEPIGSSYKGPLHLADLNSQWEQWRWGRIVAIGQGCRYPWKLGQRVMCPKAAGAKFEYEGKEYISYMEDEPAASWVEDGQ